MSRVHLAGVLWTLLVLIYAIALPVCGAEPEPPVKLTLHASAAPTPALKYRLLPNYTDQVSGNAAVNYGKVTAEEMTFFKKYAFQDIIDTWEEMPLDKLRLETVPLPESSVFFLERAAKCKYCDWQLPIGEMPFYTIMLPEAQQTRSYARILAVKARIEIANGKYDEAVKTFQTNYALARNVAEGATIVNGHIGIAISGIMHPQVLEFVQQPGSPNLYWALTKLPNPLISYRDALDVEAMGVELSFPELRDLKTLHRTPDEWRELFYRLAKQLVEQLATRDSPKPLSAEKLDELCQQKLPEAKRALIANGTPAQQVEAMSTYQIILFYSLLMYHELVDDAIKQFDFPYLQAIAGIDEVIERVKREQIEIIPIGAQILPAIKSARGAIARNEREFAVLRVIEALRMYAAIHQGKLPEELGEISEVPIPDDPVTGKPFDYRCDGERARLQGPPLFRNITLNYEITMDTPE